MAGIQRVADEHFCDADSSVHGRLDGEHLQLGVELWGWPHVTNTTSANVKHAYAAAGSYTVSLTVTGSGGTNTSTLANYVVVKPKAALGGVTLAGGKLVFSGANGPAGQPYRILTTTDVALPLAGWTPVWTNMFAADGSYSYTDATGANASCFFLLVST